jgi:2-(1,2-epoxy-1,2-dihydrophenyl)acetyl-CoA isomerase
MLSAACAPAHSRAKEIIRMNALDLDIADGVATLTLRKPEVCNALDGALIRDVNLALDRIQRADSGARAVVITGADNVFCSGLDLRSVDVSTPEGRQRAHVQVRRFMDPLMLRLSEFRYPVLAAVNGAAVGAGMTLALAADIIVVADSAFFAPSFIKLGFVPDAGSVYHLARRIGGGRSMSTLLLAERIDSSTALDWGLAYAVVPVAEVVVQTQAIARRLASGPTRAIAKLRALHASAFNTSLRDHLQAERLAHEDSLESGESVEGVRAFFEKRDPTFQSPCAVLEQEAAIPSAHGRNPPRSR